MQTKDIFKIYIDRFKDGEVETIDAESSTDFLDIDEKELGFSPKVTFRGKAYLANDHLIIQLKVSLDAFLPCSICNETVRVPLQIDNFYHTVDMSTLKNPIFDFSTLLRDTIVLTCPDFVECKNNCPERKNIKKYLKSPGKKKSPHLQFPFSQLDK